MDEAGLRRTKEVEAGALRGKEKAKVPGKEAGAKVGERGATVGVQSKEVGVEMQEKEVEAAGKV